MRVGTKFLIQDSTTKEWKTEVTAVRVSGNICTFEYDDVPRQQAYWDKHKELPTLIYKFSDGTTNIHVRILEE